METTLRKLREVGFSLIEFLIVIAVIAILVGIAAPNYLRWRATTITAEAAQQFARDVDRLRTEAKRENLKKKVAVPTSEGTSYDIIDVESGDTRTVSLPGGTIIAPLGASTEFTFSPPYGTTDAPLRSFEVRWIADPDIKRTVRVVGVTGKVIVQ